MIIIKLQGGLGNQMFQYAFGRSLEINKNIEVKYDLSDFNFINQEKMYTSIEKFESQNIKRIFSLDQFKTKISIASPYEIAPFFRKKTILNRLISKMKPAIRISESSFAFNADYLNVPNSSYLSGYWQSENYFYDIQETIKSEFQLLNNLIGKNKEFADLIKSINSVSLHIRRGDYVYDISTNNYHGICSQEYYDKAIDLILEKIKNPYLFIFSDDSKWVKENFKIKCNYSIVDFNSEADAIEDLRLMSFCKHHIIANSSFSWWGAWLNPSKEKIVIAPKEWFKNSDIDTKSLVPESWIKI